MRLESIVGDKRLIMTYDDSQIIDTRTDQVTGIICMDHLPSTNKLFGTKRRKKFLYPELREWRDYIVETELPITVQGKLPNTQYLEIELIFCVTHKYDGRDLDNFQKFIIDTIMEYFSNDDYRFSKSIAYKVELKHSTTKWNVTDGDEYCFFKIKPFSKIVMSLDGTTSMDDLEKAVRG